MPAQHRSRLADLASDLDDRSIGFQRHAEPVKTRNPRILAEASLPQHFRAGKELDVQVTINVRRWREVSVRAMRKD